MGEEVLRGDTEERDRRGVSMGETEKELSMSK